MPSLRLFAALATPDDTAAQLAAIRDRLMAAGAEGQWEPIGKLHVTVKFLGDTDEDLLPDVVYSLERCCQGVSPLLVKYSALGCFPNSRAPRVVWVGMNDLRGNLSPLKARIEDTFASLGFEKEDRPFHPHVTLGRVKGLKNVQRLIRIMESITFESQPVEIRDVALVKSELKPGGSIYTTLKRIPLTS
jgi:2'-5' RNA ligase